MRSRLFISDGENTMAGFKALSAEDLGPVRMSAAEPGNLESVNGDESAYLNDMPYCETASKPDFHTSVTSQAFVACRRHERKADTALPPTTQ